MKKLIIIVFTLLASCNLAIAQNYILFEKANKKKQLELKLGKQLHCKTLDGEMYKGVIVEISDSSIMLNNLQVLYPREIAWVYYPRRFFLATTKLGLYIGGGYAAINTINHALNGEKLLDESTYKIGGIGLAVAGVSYLAALRRLNIQDGKWDIRLIPHIKEEDL